MDALYFMYSTLVMPNEFKLEPKREIYKYIYWAITLIISVLITSQIIFIKKVIGHP